MYPAHPVSRSKLVSILESNGAEVSNSVSDGTPYLITSEDTVGSKSPKVLRAQELKCR